MKEIYVLCISLKHYCLNIKDINVNTVERLQQNTFIVIKVKNNVYTAVTSITVTL
jgi:hypothetical protein